MTVMLWTALGLGFLGSLHCVGMCGPIVLCLPQVGNSRLTFFASRIVYNLGRVVTYAAMGAICGLIGHLVSMAGYQKWISILAGILVLLAVLLPSKYVQQFAPLKPLAKLAHVGRAWWTQLLGKKSHLALFGIGILNGLLPCGFLYLGLAAAATTGSVIDSSLYMVLFGLGTVPALLLTSLFAGFARSSLRTRLLKAAPVFAVTMALLLVLRGMSLGIPYLSPKLSSTTANASPTGKQDCCK